MSKYMDTSMYILHCFRHTNDYMSIVVIQNYIKARTENPQNSIELNS